MTVYLDQRSEEDPERFAEEQKLQEELAKKAGAVVLANILWKLALGPILFFLLWNSILTPMFGIAKIGYLKSLGILTMAALIRGGPKFEN